MQDEVTPPTLVGEWFYAVIEVGFHLGNPAQAEHMLSDLLRLFERVGLDQPLHRGCIDDIYAELLQPDAQQERQHAR